MDIARIFKSKCRRALFRLYFTNPEKRYYLRELERILNTPVSIIRKELLKLEKDGIFTSHTEGNLTYFFLNKSYPLFNELKSIVFKTVGISGTLKEILSKLPGIETAFIFGSYAKDQTRADSDVDLFIIGKIDEHKLIREINHLEKALGREINYSLFTEQDFKKKKKDKNPFITDLMNNPKIFLKGDESDLQ